TPDAHSVRVEEVSVASGAGVASVRVPPPAQHVPALAPRDLGLGVRVLAMAAGEHVPGVARTFVGASSATEGCSDEDFTSLFLSFWCRSRPWQVGDRMRIRRPGNQTDTATATVYRIDDGTFVFAAIDGDT